MEENKIRFINEDGQTEEFFVIEQTKLGDFNYLLVTEKDEDDAEAYILKDVSEEGSADSVYEFVEDDTELDALADIFAELLDGEADII